MFLGGASLPLGGQTFCVLRFGLHAKESAQVVRATFENVLVQGKPSEQGQRSFVALPGVSLSEVENGERIDQVDGGVNSR